MSDIGKSCSLVTAGCGDSAPPALPARQDGDILPCLFLRLGDNPRYRLAILQNNSCQDFKRIFSARKALLAFVARSMRRMQQPLLTGQCMTQFTAKIKSMVAENRKFRFSAPEI